MRRHNAITVPPKRIGSVATVRRVFAAVLNRGRNDEPDLPAGWVQLGVDGDGRPLYGYIGPRNPSFRFDSIEDLRRRWG
jgi:hypothetical protein